MISMFATGDFVRCDIREDYYGLGRVGLIMGVALLPSTTESGVNHLMAVVTGQDGEIGLVAVNDLRTDYVYDPERDTFVDRSALERGALPPVDEEGEMIEQ